MKQQLFEDRHQAEWLTFTGYLDQLESSRRNAKPDAAAIAAYPAAYRRVCMHLAIARERQYSSRLIDQLSTLAFRGYQQLYRAPRGRLSALLEFIGRDFPRMVRAEAHLFWLCSLLFYLPLLMMAWLIYMEPELIYSMLGAESVESVDQMYQPGHSIRAERAADSDVLMFGFYIYNNIGIGFRTFASGMLFAIGSIFILIFNGIYIGAIAGYLTERGYIETFYPFVIAHGAFELTGIVLAGVAGMRLGLALIAPGRYSRLQALKIAAARSVKIVYGVITLLLLAAFIEAFWSSQDTLPGALRYGVGALCWLLLSVYLLWAGRDAD
jgi:uncharacterized membrane protein SpoIIM required for sporulation